MARLPPKVRAMRFLFKICPRGDWALRLAVNTGLAQTFRSGQNEDLFKRWFSQIGLRPGVMLAAIYTLGGLAD